MDPSLITQRLGQQITSMRKHRGLTMIQLAAQAGVTRQKLSEIERGRESVGIGLYAKVLAALQGELNVTPARRPTFEELSEVFRETD